VEDEDINELTLMDVGAGNKKPAGWAGFDRSVGVYITSRAIAPPHKRKNATTAAKRCR